MSRLQITGERGGRLAYFAVYVALSLAFCWPLLVRPFANGVGDWDQHFFYYASVLRSIASYGEPPFWNPWYCGGNVLWQNPQVPLLNPVYLLALVMPLALAMKLYVLGQYVVGCLGMHLVVRRIVGVRSPAVAIYLVSLFAFSGAMAMHLAAGHSNFLWVFWLPALVYCFFRTIEGQTRMLLVGGAILGFAILNGAPHVVPLAAVLLGALALGAMISGRIVRPLVLAVVMVVAGCVYAAPKLVPAVAFSQSAHFHDRRDVKRPDYMSVEMFRRALLDSSQKKTLKVTPGVQLYAWHEYGNYMGWFGAVLTLVSAIWILVFRWRRENWREVSAALAFAAALLLMAGDFARFAPANLLRDVPLFASFRIPSRYTFLVPILGAMCIAYVARVLQDRWSPVARRLVEIVCVVGICQLGWVNRENLRDIFILPSTPTEARQLERTTPIVAVEEPPTIEWTRLGENSKLLRTMAAGVSPLNCYEPILARRIAVPGPAGMQSEGAVTFSETAFSPNRVGGRVQVAKEPVRVVLNQNFADGWSTNIGPVERDPERGRPSIVVPAGYAGTLAFRFVPPGLWPGVALWVLAIAVSILVWRRTISSSLHGPRAPEFNLQMNLVVDAQEARQ